MRLWSLHPKYLDRIGLVALWREGLLAKKVLEGNTRGYRNHPQLVRFKNHKNPIGAIDSYMTEVWREAKKRGYNFDTGKINSNAIVKEQITITSGQIKYEMDHLLKKLERRSKEDYFKHRLVQSPECFMIFVVKEGEVESWEVV